MRYLDPKADLTFKKVFGNHPRLIISLLNALLPLDKGDEVTEVEYLPAEMAPRTPTAKDTIVDVRCRDNRGRQFIVEMQMVWSKEYKQRMVFNAAKAYVGQLNSGEDYELLQPVYSLNLVNDIFEKDVDEWYHYYRLVHNRYNNKVIEGLQLILVELPKFTPHTMTEKKMAALWLRFLTEINGKTRKVPQELLDNADVKNAIEIVEESAYTEAEMLAYDRFWDSVSIEKTLINSVERRYKKGLEDGHKRGMEEGRKKGMEEGRKEGLEKGMEEGRKKGMEEGRKEGEQNKAMQIARNMLGMNLPVEVIMKTTGLSEEEIEKIVTP